MTPQPAILTKDAILGATDRPIEILNVPEWGGAVRIRGLNAGAALRIATLDKVDQLKVVMQQGVVDENGAPLFSEQEIPALFERSLGTVTAVTEKIIAMSKLGGHAAGK